MGPFSATGLAGGAAGARRGGAGGVPGSEGSERRASESGRSRGGAPLGRCPPGVSTGVARRLASASWGGMEGVRGRHWGGSGRGALRGAVVASRPPPALPRRLCTRLLALRGSLGQPVVPLLLNQGPDFLSGRGGSEAMGAQTCPDHRGHRGWNALPARSPRALAAERKHGEGSRRPSGRGGWPRRPLSGRDSRAPPAWHARGLQCAHHPGLLLSSLLGSRGGLPLRLQRLRALRGSERLEMCAPVPPRPQHSPPAKTPSHPPHRGSMRRRPRAATPSHRFASGVFWPLALFRAHRPNSNTDSSAQLAVSWDATLQLGCELSQSHSRFGATRVRVRAALVERRCG